jgi:hypothetical protein
VPPNKYKWHGTRKMLNTIMPHGMNDWIQKGTFPALTGSEGGALPVSTKTHVWGQWQAKVNTGSKVHGIQDTGSPKDGDGPTWFLVGIANGIWARGRPFHFCPPVLAHRKEVGVPRFLSNHLAAETCITPSCPMEVIPRYKRACHLLSLAPSGGSKKIIKWQVRQWTLCTCK